MTTGVKLGWARQQYGRDRFDVTVDRADLPLILAEHGADPELASQIPYSRQMEIIRVLAEIMGRTVYYRHEDEEARVAGTDRPTPAMKRVLEGLREHKERLAELIAPYVPAADREKEPATA